MNDTRTDTQPAPHDHVVATELDGGEGVLVDLNTKRYYQLYETAMFVWKRLEKNVPLARIAEEMTSVYDVTPERASQSVAALVQNLQTRKLVK
ncbi:MAG TPA: PqqD family protein [Pyrinomonadaceae bacterium]|nr:PqqD family protein [Pyrinomonadaceae bacterium]